MNICNECLIIKDKNGDVLEKINCKNCKNNKLIADFGRLQLLKEENERICIDCIKILEPRQEIMFYCINCQQKLSKLNFTKNQYRKEAKQCKECIEDNKKIITDDEIEGLEDEPKKKRNRRGGRGRKRKSLNENDINNSNNQNSVNNKQL